MIKIQYKKLHSCRQYLIVYHVKNFGEVVGRDGEHEARDVENWTPAVIIRKLGPVQRRRHQNNLRHVRLQTSICCTVYT